jgi:hypothetical protein
METWQEKAFESHAAGDSGRDRVYVGRLSLRIRRGPPQLFRYNEHISRPLATLLCNQTNWALIVECY